MDKFKERYKEMLFDRKKDAEIKELRENKSRITAAHKKLELLLKESIIDQLFIWVESFELPHLRTENDKVNAKANEIKERFILFKNLAKKELIDNMSL